MGRNRMAGGSPTASGWQVGLRPTGAPGTVLYLALAGALGAALALLSHTLGWERDLTLWLGVATVTLYVAVATPTLLGRNRRRG